MDALALCRKWEDVASNREANGYNGGRPSASLFSLVWITKASSLAWLLNL
jgi:hypothetical protein